MVLCSSSLAGKEGRHTCGRFHEWRGRKARTLPLLSPACSPSSESVHVFQALVRKALYVEAKVYHMGDVSKEDLLMRPHSSTETRQGFQLSTMDLGA